MSPIIIHVHILIHTNKMQKIDTNHSHSTLKVCNYKTKAYAAACHKKMQIFKISSDIIYRDKLKLVDFVMIFFIFSFRKKSVTGIIIRAKIKEYFDNIWFGYVFICSTATINSVELPRWSLGKDKLFHATHYSGCNDLSMLGLKLIHVSKRGHWNRPCYQVSSSRGKNNTWIAIT